MNEETFTSSPKKRLGEILVELGLITEEQLFNALEIQSKEKRLLGQVLVKLGYVTPETIISALDMQEVSLFDSSSKDDI
ncbi:MAG: hypothetical protein AABZ74_13620 [Cyanobacteriota bacterium]